MIRANNPAACANNGLSIDDLVTQPSLYQVPMLSNNLMDVHLLDYSPTTTHTHKIQKALFTVKYCRDKLNAPIMLFGNFGKEKRQDKSEGSTMDALELASFCYPTTQVIGFFHSDTPVIDFPEVNKDFPNERRKVRLGINTDKYLSPKDIEKLFQKFLSRSKALRDYLTEQGMDPYDNCVAVTHLSEFVKDGEDTPYKYRGDIRDEMRKMDLIVSTIGTGERAWGQIRSVHPSWKQKNLDLDYGPEQIFLIPQDHVMNPFPGLRKETVNNRLSTRFSNPDHKKILRYAANNPQIYFKLIRGSEKMTAYEKINDFKDGCGIASMLYDSGLTDLAIGPSGAVGLSILSPTNYTLDPEDDMLTKKQLKQTRGDGMLFHDLFRYKGYFGVKAVKDSLFLPRPRKKLFGNQRKYNVCIVYTGCSDDKFAKEFVKNTETN